MLTTRLEVLTEPVLTSRTIGDRPASGCLSRVTVIVTCDALPAVVTDGFPASTRLRSLASAAGAATSAANAAKTTSLRMFPPSGCRSYTGRGGQVPQRADLGQRARMRTRAPRNSIRTDAALF